MTPLIQAAGLAISRGERRVLSRVDFSFNAGEFVALLGLNGAGKSTLLETLAGVLRGYGGTCLLQGRELREYSRRQLSQRLSFLPQWQTPSTGFTVRQIVSMGRYPHSSGWAESPADRRAIEEAMEACQCSQLAARRFQTLSGGERQRSLLAAALAQQTAILALDEPSAHADPPLQATLFALLRKRSEQGCLCIAAVHDLNLAVSFATRAVLLHEGSIAYDGGVEGFLASPAFEQVFGPQIMVRQAVDGHRFATYAQRWPA